MDTYGLMLTAQAFVGKFAYKCRPLIWVDTPTLVSVMLHPKAISDSVKEPFFDISCKHCEFKKQYFIE
jgi:hypothetical protein